MSLPINKEYLEQSFVDYDTYLHNEDPFIHTHSNKSALDKISESETGTLLFNGKEFSDGKDGSPGNNGKSAYEIAVDNGFTGTEKEWLESLKGEPGEDSNIDNISASSIGAAKENHLHGYMKIIRLATTEPTIVLENEIVMVCE